MSCDCREFSELLLDFAYGELEDADVARLSEHAASCAACAKQLDEIRATRKLAAQMTAEKIEPSLAEVVLAEAARAVAEARSPVAHAAPKEPGFVEKLVWMLRRPAFAGTLAALVVVAGSLAVFSRFSHEPSRPESSSSSPLAAQTAAPSPLPPAPPSAVLEAALGESRPKEPEPAPVAVASAEPKPSADTGRRYSAGKGSLGTQGPGDRRDLEELPSGGGGGGGRSGGGGSFASAPSGSAAPRAKAPASHAALDSEADDGFSGGYPSGAVAAGGEGARAEEKFAAPGPAAAPEAEVADKDISDFDEAMGAYERGDCATATPIFARIADGQGASPGEAPKALHHLARCAKRSGSCGRAVVHYERLLAEWPAYSDRPAATFEAAVCHRKLGHFERALELLETIEGLPGWDDRVRAEKENVKGAKKSAP